MRKYLVGRVRNKLHQDSNWAQHFSPNYQPWDQRLCVVPDDNLFDAINAHKAVVITDTISTFDNEGLVLASGKYLKADIVVLATGLVMTVLGKITISIDGKTVNLSETWTYKGFAFSDVPNLATSNGYINASFGIRASMTSLFLCRILNHMRAVSAQSFTPRLRYSDRLMKPTGPASGFNPGYFQRSAHLFPKEGDRMPWMNVQDYRADRKSFITEPINDGVLKFH